MTPSSSITAYLSVADFLARKDTRSVAQYAVDDSSNPIPLTFPPLPTILYTNASVLAAINSACGMLESACLRGEAYTVADLQALNGMSLEYMKSILSNISMYNMVDRRPGPNPPDMVITSYNAAMQQLDALSRGERIFSYMETQQAGLPANAQIQIPQLYMNNLLSVRWSSMFGRRQSLSRNRPW